MSGKLSPAKLREMWGVFIEKPTGGFVAKVCGVSETTVRRYRKLDKWDERLDEIKKGAAKRVDLTVEKIMAENLGIFRLYKKKMFGALKKKRITAKNVNPRDLDLITRGEIFYAGGVERREEIKIKGKISGEEAEHIRMALEIRGKRNAGGDGGH